MRQYDIHLVRLDPTLGSEIRKTRPCIVISPDEMNAHLRTVQVAPLTSNARAYPWRVAITVQRRKGMVALDWKSMDKWFEEDEEVSIHARDPYTRIDILPSSRTVRIEIDGETVAESKRPRILHESGLPPRYYLPKADVRLDLMTPTSTSSGCPYKGTARYWTVTAGGGEHEDIVWGYDAPLPESAGIAGYVSFYNEKVDIYVDGELQERPNTKF